MQTITFKFKITMEISLQAKMNYKSILMFTLQMKMVRKFLL